MIRQGSNKPITITFDDVPGDISITLHNEVETLKHWAKNDLIASEDQLTYTAPVEQSESKSWEEGPADIEVRWIDGTGIVQKIVIRETIEWTMDSAILTEE